MGVISYIIYAINCTEAFLISYYNQYCQQVRIIRIVLHYKNCPVILSVIIFNKSNNEVSQTLADGLNSVNIPLLVDLERSELFTQLLCQMIKVVPSMLGCVCQGSEVASERWNHAVIRSVASQCSLKEVGLYIHS